MRGKCPRSSPTPVTHDLARPGDAWLTLLASYTGARQAELANLTKADIKQDPGGWHISILDDPENGKSLKTETSRRDVPLHPELIRLGFVKFVGASEDDLFDRNAAAFSKRWMRWLRDEAEITDRRLTFHSLRHTFKRACRDAGVLEEVHDALTGHSGVG